MKTSMKLSKSDCLTIPKNMRVRLGWKTGMSLDISAATDGSLIIRKHAEICRFCGSTQNLVYYRDLCMCRNCTDSMLQAVKEGEV